MRLPFPVRDANATPGTDGLGQLPEWDLTDLYPTPDGPEFAADMDKLAEECASFAADYAGKLGDLDAAGLLEAVQRNETLSTRAGRIMSYAGLRYYQVTTDAERAKFMADAQDRMTGMTAQLVFWELELNRLDEDKLQAMLAENEELGRYRPLFERLRAMKPHQLSDELEQFLHDQSTVGSAAWNRLFDETVAGLTFDVDGDELPLEATLDLLTDQDRARREMGAKAVAKVFSENVKLFARVHNTLAKEKEIEDRWRNMPTAQTGRHLSNQVEPEVVEALRNAVVAAYPKLSHRYYALKAKWLGLDTLEVW
ncbi:MAG: oligoendopeptidase F, partial [Pseudomonadota bacterium]